MGGGAGRYSKTGTRTVALKSLSGGGLRGQMWARKRRSRTEKFELKRDRERNSQWKGREELKETDKWVQRKKKIIKTQEM